MFHYNVLMPIYQQQTPGAAITAVEFTTVAGKQVSIFHLADAAKKDELLQWLGTTQQLVSESKKDGTTVLVTQGVASPDTVIGTLAQHGEMLALPAPEKKKFNPWLWRGITSIIGQSLQIASSLSGKGSAADRSALFGFASLNLTANFINILFGGQEKNDTHQLRYLKNQFNASIAPTVGENNLPNVEEKHAATRTEQKRSSGEGVYNWLRKYSVTGGEIGLRTLGATSLAFPITRWAGGFKAFKQTGSLSKTLEAVRNTNNVTFYAGLATLLGKFTSFAAVEPDPYNPKPPSLIHQFREKVAFRLSSVIEGGAAMWMTHDRFTKQKINIGGKIHPDYYGGVGNAVFVGGYGIRLAAPYGTREVDMKELTAHISDGLAKAPEEQRPQLLLNTALDLHAHFANLPPDKKNPKDIASLYQRIAEDLQKQHGIAVGPMPAPAGRIEGPKQHELLEQRSASVAVG